MCKSTHSQLTISVDKHVGMDPDQAIVKAELQGCKDCLQTAITNLLLYDESFKGLINRSIRAANEIKSKTQN